MISREEAAKRLKRIHNYMHDGYIRHLEHGGEQDEDVEGDIEALCMAIEALSQPERPKGRWKFVELKDHPLYGKPLKVGEYRCPFCGRAVAFKPPYCHCGADMRGEEE